MTLHEARAIAYDAKAKQLHLGMSKVRQAVATLEKGRAVEHRRDEDRRLANHLRAHVGMARAE